MMLPKLYVAGLAVCVGLLASGASADSNAGPARQGSLHCEGAVGGTPVTWRLELDESLPLAVVDGADAPAEYSPSHLTVRLAHEGPALFVGRKTGWLVVAGKDGRTIGTGQCAPIVTAALPSAPALQAPSACPAKSKGLLSRPVRTRVPGLIGV